jgi:exosortase/archaeosortase family protein
MAETMAPPRRVAGPGLRLLLLVGLAAVAFVLLVDSFRDIEAAIANFVLGPFGGGTRSGGLLILRIDELSSVGLRVGRSCSALAILLGCAVAALGLLRARPSRRGVALLIGAAAGLAANTLRIVALALVARWSSTDTMVQIHDWAGTIFTIVATAACIGLVLWIGSRPTRAPAS